MAEIGTVVKEDARLSKVVLAKNGSDYNVTGLNPGDSVVLKDETGSALLRFDWDTVNRRFYINLAGNQFVLHTSGSVEKKIKNL